MSEQEQTGINETQRAQTRKASGLVLMLSGAVLLGVLLGWVAFSPVDNGTSRDSGTVTSANVPQSCLDALNAGEKGFTYAADALDAASDGFLAVFENNIAGMEAAANDVQRAGDSLLSVERAWNGNKADCRAAAR